MGSSTSKAWPNDGSSQSVTINSGSHLPSALFRMSLAQVRLAQQLVATLQTNEVEVTTALFPTLPELNNMELFQALLFATSLATLGIINEFQRCQSQRPDATANVYKEAISVGQSLLLQYPPEVIRRLLTAHKLLTAVFVKNMSFPRLLDMVFETEIEGRAISDHIMEAFVMCVTCFANEGGILRELGQSALLAIGVFVSAQMPEVEDPKILYRYFHKKLVSIPAEQSASFTLALFKLFSSSSGGHTLSFWPTRNAEVSCSKSLILSMICALAYPTSDAHADESNAHDLIISMLTNLEDAKLFVNLLQGVEIIFNAYPDERKLADLVQASIFLNFMLNFCPSFSRFLLSRLDDSNFALTISRVLTILTGNVGHRLDSKQAINASQQQQIRMVFVTLLQNLARFSEDSTFMKLLFGAPIDPAALKQWYDGHYQVGNTCTGNFVFGIMLDSYSKLKQTGVVDVYLDRIWLSFLLNCSQHVKDADKFISDKFSTALAASATCDDDMITILLLLINGIMNSPRQNCALVLLLLKNNLLSQAIVLLDGHLAELDVKINSSCASRLDDASLVYSSILSGLSRFLTRLQGFIVKSDWHGPEPSRSLLKLQDIMESYPTGSIRRDPSGEVWLRGVRARADGDTDIRLWVKFVSNPVGWPLLHSFIPWQTLV